MGRRIMQYDGSYVLYCGGEPKHDWSELTDESKLAPTRATQSCSLSVNDERKASEYRLRGLEQRFKQTDSLEQFQAQVKTHLLKYGLDTISYLPDPVEPTQMVSVVDHHAKFSQETAKQAHYPLRPRFDKYDLENDALASDFLMNSIDPDFASLIRNKVDLASPFAILWMTIIAEIRSSSISHFVKDS